MKKIMCLLAAFIAFATPVRAQEVPQSVSQLQMSFSPLVKKTAPAVVNIYAKRVVKEQMRMISPFFNDPFFNQFFGGIQRGGNGMVRERVENALGSGVIVDPKGIIATNTHVVKGASEIIVVTNDGREFSATIQLVDEKTDLAIIKMDTKGETMPFLEMADSDTLEVGDIVLAIGNPFGVGQTVTSGIVSGLARTGVGVTDYGLFIQTDAAINPGNSGGALIDVNGRLIGVNSMIFSKDGGSLGIGFAIPANMVKTVVSASRSGSKLVRPWSGFTGQTITSDMVESLGLRRAYGVLVNKVAAGGPAEKAGVKVGDIVTTIDGKEVKDPEALKFRFAMLPMGSPVHLQVVREGKSMDLVITTEAPPEKPARDESKLEGRNPLAGAVVANLSPALIEEMGSADAEQGVVVMTAQEGNAARLGLMHGDVILAINGEKVESVAALKKVLKSTNNKRWQVQMLRKGQVLNLMITI